MKSSFSEVWDEVEKGAQVVGKECARLEDVPLDLDVLKQFKRFDVGAYDYCEDQGNEMLTKFVGDYRKAAGEFNRLLDNKIINARRFVIKQNREEKQKLEQMVREAQRNAIQESRRADEVEKYFTAENEKLAAEKDAVERQLYAERDSFEEQIFETEQEKKQLEKHLGSHMDLKKTYNLLADQMDYLKDEVKSLKDTQSGNGKRLQSELTQGFEELRKEFKHSRKKPGESHLADALGKVADLYELLNCYDEILNEERKTQEMVARVEDKVDFYGKRQDNLVDDIVAKVMDEFDRRNKKEENTSADFVQSVKEDIGEPITYELRNLKKAALGDFGCSYNACLKKINELVAELPVTDYDGDLEFLLGFELAMRKSVQEGDIRYAMENHNLNKKLVKNTLRAVQEYVRKFVVKQKELYEPALLS